MTFTLTPEQEQLFKTVLMYMNNERKSALMQLLDGEKAKTIVQISREFMEYPNADSGYLPKQLVLSILNKALSPLELAVEETVVGERGRGAKAFRLTEKGEQVKRYAGFALEQMARLFDQSVYTILGTTNTKYNKVRPQQAVRLLYVANEGPVSVQDLIDDISLTDRFNIYDILNNLSSFKDGLGNAIPLIEVRDPKIGDGYKGYRWVRGSSMPTTTRPTKRWTKLVNTLSSDPDRVWTQEELAQECGYDPIGVLSRSLHYLESKGNIRSGSSHELRMVYITDHGRLLIHSLFEPIKGDIAGDEVSKGIIDRNQPISKNLIRILGLYVGIKNLERGYQPAVK